VGNIPDLGGTGSTPPSDGVVSGAVLRAIRMQLRHTQDQAAELFGVDRNTIKGWESGRRPLANVRVQTLRAMRRTLGQLGIEPALLGQLDTAIDVDLVIGQILTGRHTPTDHPLATWVHTREWHDLLGWALNGSTPAALNGIGATVPQPRLATVDRAALFDSLRTTAEQAGDEPSSTLLRRQVIYLATWEDSPAGQDWVARQERLELRRLRPIDDWTPTWVAGRSLAVARACQGDPDRLRHFMRTQLTTDSQEAANLNYWANWCGADPRPAISDDFMASGDLGRWDGAALLRHLVAGLNPATPYIELTIHSVWALLARRPQLLTEDHTLTTDLRQRATRLLDEATLADQARRELEQVLYAANLKGR
jgi:transcriptional regulator with XRE-family HTH domain